MSQKWWYRPLQDSPWQTIRAKDSCLDVLHGASDLIKLYANAAPTSGSMFILNQSGNLISMVDNANVYESGILGCLKEGYSNSYVGEINGLDYQIVTNTVRTPLWRVVTITSAQQLRTQYSTSTLLIPTLTALFLLVLVVFLL